MKEFKSKPWWASFCSLLHPFHLLSHGPCQAMADRFTSRSTFKIANGPCDQDAKLNENYNHKELVFFSLLFLSVSLLSPPSSFCPRENAKKIKKMQALPTSVMAISSLPSSSAGRFTPFRRSPFSIFLHFSASEARALKLGAVKGAQAGRIRSSQEPESQEPLRRPLVSPSSEDEEDDLIRKSRSEDVSEGEDLRGGSRRRRQDWMDWEDQILQDTVPLVSFVRMILHSGKYAFFQAILYSQDPTFLIFGYILVSGCLSFYEI